VSVAATMAALETIKRKVDEHPVLVAALEKAKDGLGQLIAAIEQHHATSPCKSEALFAEADRQYRILDTIRAALAQKETP
jgi:hypothetical protein